MTKQAENDVMHVCVTLPHKYLVFLCCLFIRVCVSEPTQGPDMFLLQEDHTSSSTQKTSLIMGHG